MKRFNLIFLLIIILFIMSCTKLPDIGPGYKLDFGHNGNLGVFTTRNAILVDEHILDYAFDSIFILIVHLPEDSILDCRNADPITRKKAVKKSTFQQYWIINKSEANIFDTVTRRYSNLYGPYKKDVYLEKKRELGVPENLKLKIELEK